MFYNDFTNAKNIAHDWIRWPCVRVSSAMIPGILDGVPFGCYYETWVFSDCPAINTIQACQKTKQKAIKAHNHIVQNLKQKLVEYNHQGVLYRRFD